MFTSADFFYLWEKVRPTALRGLRWIIAFMERHLKNLRYNESIMEGQAFPKMRETLKSKQKQLKRLRKGNKLKEPSLHKKKLILFIINKESQEFICHKLS